MPSFSNLFGAGGGEGASAEQFLLWGVAYGFAQALLAPVFSGVQQKVWAAAVAEGLLVVPSPADAADWVERGIIPRAEGEAMAAQSGEPAGNFDARIANAGQPPGMETVLEMWRRGIISTGAVGPGQTTVENAIATSRIYTYWTDAIKAMASRPISPADAVDAALRGQRPRPDMEREAFASGIDAERFSVLFDTAGRPPSPGELIELVRRGFIPLRGVGPAALSLQQGIFEGDAKDKWEPAYEQLVTYKPPPRTVSTLVAHGAIDDATALAFYADAGLDASTAAAYLHLAHSEKTSGGHALSQSQLIKLYSDRVMTAAQVTTALEALGFDAPDIAFLLELADLDVAHTAYRQATSRVGAAFVKGLIDAAKATAELETLDVPAAAVTQLLAAWSAEKAATAHALTAAEVAAAVFYQVMTQEQGMAQLQQYGYSAVDAWRLLSIRAHGALPNPPEGA